MSAFKDKIWQQILDGKKRWNASLSSVPTQEELDLFEIEIVKPLQELEAERVITLDTPHIGSYRFGRRTDVMLVREVNWNKE